MQEPSLNREVWSVNDLTKYIKGQLEEDRLLRDIWVRGEISNFKHHSRGHMYFTLKDAHSRILAVMFAGYNRFLRFQPKDGLKIILRGEISLYERDGQYQLYVKEMQPDGVGNLYLAYEQLKNKLQANGYFAQKRALPSFPQKTALITSPTGAAVRDMITTLRRRYPLVDILIIPVLVQGEFAPDSIQKGIQYANQIDSVDVIILGRGGGSIEELWAFNDENVALSIYHSRIPTISAVGHETDYTIADFVADKRAATPTAAAEIAVPHIRELYDFVRYNRERVNHALKRIVQRKQHQLERLQHANVLRRPTDQLKQHNQQLDRLTDRLKRLVQQYPDMKRKQLSFLHRRVFLINAPAKIENEMQYVERLKKQLYHRIHKQLEGKKIGLSFLIQQLDSLSPLSVLKRGYTLSFDQDKKIVNSVAQVSPGDLLYVQFKDGVVQSTIWGIDEEDSLWDKKK